MKQWPPSRSTWPRGKTVGLTANSHAGRVPPAQTKAEGGLWEVREELLGNAVRTES